MSTDRKNTNLAAAVNQALILADQLGVQSAARFLAAHGAGFALICRVLGEPTRRRARRVPTIR
jgi:hypothetical protein